MTVGASIAAIVISCIAIAISLYTIYQNRKDD